MSRNTWSGRRRARNASAISLVAKSATTTATAVPQKSRRSAAFTIFLSGLALDAEAGVRDRVGALIGHVEGVAREIAVRSLEARVERLTVVTQLFDHPRALFEQPLLEMGQLLLVQAGFGLHLG